MSHRVTLVPGDCPEILAGVKQVVAATGVRIDWDEPEISSARAAARDIEPAGPEQPTDRLLASARETKLALMGWKRGNRELRQLPPVVKLREELGVFAQLRPIQDLPGLGSRFQDVDILVVRETTEDVYAHLEHESIPGVFESLKVTTRAACERIARYAFETARAQNRRKITIVHKANIMKLSDGMFLRTALRVAEDYPDIEHEEVIVDALCMKIVLDPGRYDVLVTGNLFGDIVADMCAGLVGGASNAPSINVAKDGTVLFTASHGDPPEVSGTGKANPLNLLLPTVHLLRHVGEREAAQRLRTALATTLTSGLRPFRLGGETRWDTFCEAVSARLASAP